VGLSKYDTRLLWTYVPSQRPCGGLVWKIYTHPTLVWTGLYVQLTQGIKNTLALPIDKMLYIYLLCPHSEHQKNSFQSKQSKHFHQRNWFTQCETGSNKVKLPKVGSNAIVPAPTEAGPNNPQWDPNWSRKKAAKRDDSADKRLCGGPTGSLIT
jgi:hypothetical protein